MTGQEIHTAYVKVTNGDLQIDAYLAHPIRAEAVPGIVVLQEIFGVNAHIREVTERLARMGYAAIAPAIYQRLAPGLELGYTDEDVKLGRKYKEQTQAEELLGDVRGAIAYLQTLPQVQSDAIGCIGFCFGGHVAYLAATLPEIKATVSFYGAGITTLTPGGGLPTLTRTREIRGTLYGFFGMEDASIPSEQIDQIEAELQQYQVPHRIFRYEGAGHGFFCDRRASYEPKAAADAWEQVQKLFQAVL